MTESKKVIKKITLTEVIKNKEKYQVKDDIKDDVLIPRLEGSITIKKPERSLCLESFAMAKDENQANKADDFVVYNTCVEPNLKDPELQKTFDCTEPIDIVQKIFESGEISQIALIALGLAGYNKNISKVSDLKNS